MKLWCHDINIIHSTSIVCFQGFFSKEGIPSFKTGLLEPLEMRVPYSDLSVHLSSKGETITCVNGKVSFFAGKRLQHF